MPFIEWLSWQTTNGMSPDTVQLMWLDLQDRKVGRYSITSLSPLPTGKLMFATWHFSGSCFFFFFFQAEPPPHHLSAWSWQSDEETNLTTRYAYLIKSGGKKIQGCNYSTIWAKLVLFHHFLVFHCVSDVWNGNSWKFTKLWTCGKLQTARHWHTNVSRIWNTVHSWIQINHVWWIFSFS